MIATGSRQDAQSALNELRNWMAPASMEALVVALSELYLTTARAKEVDDDLKAVVALYSRKLRDYPGDIACDVVEKYAGKFFPAFADLRDAIISDSRFVERRARLIALEEYIKTGGEPQRQRITREQADSIAAKYAAA